MRFAFMTGWRPCALALSAGAALSLVTAGATAAEKSLGQKQRAAADAVREALQREVYGLDEDRRQLLDEAAQQVTDFAPAMWHRGYVRDGFNRWVEYASLIQQPKVSVKLANYEKMQATTPDTLAGHLAAAEWCAKQELPEQRRAHLTRALDHEPNHLYARSQLGFLRVAGEWQTRQQLAAASQALRAEQASLAKYREVLEGIGKDLAHDSLARREAAKKRLWAIREADAIPAMEVILSPQSEEAALAVVEAVAAITDNAAALSLARHAVHHPQLPVRKAAVEKLKSRDTFTFVPQLLAAMFTPVTSEVVAGRLSDGSLGYRHSFVREGQEKKQLLVLDTNYQRVALAGGDSRDTSSRAVGQAESAALQREMAVRAQNRLTQELNDRITWVLKLVTGEQLPAVPADWWAWWNEFNEIEQTGEKSLAYIQQQTSIAVVDRVVSTEGGQSGSTGTVECLVAGTPIWTIHGPRAVETVKVGDLVLAQDAETGELAYKPVLRSTFRPRGPTVKFIAGSETFETSGGHVFWVAGQGWRKSSQLQSGMVLHSIDGPVRVSTVEPGAEAETFNLIVADFSTYFVGESKILSHDFTQRGATRTLVPGLQAE